MGNWSTISTKLLTLKMLFIKEERLLKIHDAKKSKNNLLSTENQPLQKS